MQNGKHDAPYKDSIFLHHQETVLLFSFLFLYFIIFLSSFSVVVLRSREE